MTLSLSRLADAVLIERFRNAARDLGDAVVDWMPAERKANRLFAIKQEVRRRGHESRLKLAILLDDNDRFVRYYAAKELFGLFPQKCRLIVEENTREFDALMGDARHFLRAIDEGTYKPQ